MDNKMTAEQALAEVQNRLRDIRHHVWGGGIQPYKDVSAIENLIEFHVVPALSAPRVPDGVRSTIEEAASHLKNWLELDLCDCEGSHHCGYRDVKRTRDALLSILAASPEPVAPRVPDWEIDWSKAPAGTERAIHDESIVTWLKMSPGRGVMSWRWHARAWYLHTNTEVANAMWESAIPKPEPVNDTDWIDMPSNLRRQTNTEQHAQQLIDDLRAEVEALKADAERYRAGLIAVECLINNSAGVYGMHLNGNCSPWGDLLTGGQFEEWLMDFDAAIDAARQREGGE